MQAELLAATVHAGSTAGELRKVGGGWHESTSSIAAASAPIVIDVCEKEASYVGLQQEEV